MSKRQPEGKAPERSDGVGRSSRAASAAHVPRAADAVVAVSEQTRQLVLQAKLQVGAANDPLEAEADAMAAAYRTWTPAAVDGGPADGGGVPDVRRVRRAATATAGPMGSFAAPRDVEARIAAARGKGSALPGAMRASFEGFFGADLGAVRVHQGGESAGLNRSLSARAFTTGTDVFLGHGESLGDQSLMAHELTHVVQQGGGASRTVQCEEAGGTLTDKVAMGGKATEVGGGAMEKANTAHEMIEGEEISAAGFGESSEILGLASALAGLWEAVAELFKKKENAVGEETIAEGVRAVSAAGEAVKGAISVAQAFGASVAMAVVPGLDLALSSLSLVMHATKQFTLYQALFRENTAIADAGEGTDKSRALNTVHTRTWKAIGLGWAELVGDAMLIAGSALNLTGVGAVGGLVLKGLGAAVQFGATFANLAMQHSEAKATQAARKAYGDAEKGKDPKALAAAKSKRLDADVAFAVDELLTLVTEQADAATAYVLAAFGIGPNWLERYAKSDAASRPAQREEAKAIVLSYLGAEEDPQTLGQMVENGLKKIKDGVSKLFSRKKKG